MPVARRTTRSRTTASAKNRALAALIVAALGRPNARRTGAVRRKAATPRRSYY